MKMKRALFGVVATACCAAIGLPAAATGPGADSTERFHDRFALFVKENPGDYTGLAALVEGMGSTLDIKLYGVGEVEPEVAQAAYDAMDGQELLSDGTISPMAWPTDAFTVGLATSQAPGSATVSITGTWNFRDDFLGQGPPVDIASIAISQGCGTWSGYYANTYRYDGVSTNRASLRSGGVGTTGPAWNINDTISNFMSYADHGTVGAVYDLTHCSGAVQTEFVYEGNDGGSVVNVSLGWGAFTVTYSNPGQTMQKSTGAKTL